jgi:small-conductance mechanosensitive channel
MEDLKIDTRPFYAIIFAGGLAIALALQSSLSNFAAGLWIVLFKPYKIGDLVMVGDNLGVIVDIDFLFSRLQLYNGSIIVIPNAQVLSNGVQNFYSSNIYRVRTEVLVSYKADLKKVLKTFTSILEKMPNTGIGKKNNYVNSCISAANHQIWIKGFEASGILIRVSYWIDSPLAEVSFTNNFREAIITQFKKEMIEIPFNRLDVKIMQNEPDS